MRSAVLRAGRPEVATRVTNSLGREARGGSLELRPLPGAVQVEQRYPQVEGVGVRVAREPAVAYHARVSPEQAAADADEAFEHARYDYELAGALRAGFGDLKAGRVMPHAEFMAELRALIQA